MAATHKFENCVRNGEIFYRWPGAVWYTVFAYARQADGSNDITEGQVVKEVTLGVFLYGAVAGVSVATMGTMLAPTAVALAPLAVAGTLTAEAAAAAVLTASAEAAVAGAIAGASFYNSAEAAKEALGLAFKKSNLYCEMKGCYGGGSGSWLVVEGGPYMDSSGHWQPQDLKLRKATQEELFRNGKFTRYSHSCYHTQEDLQCTENCPYC